MKKKIPSRSLPTSAAGLSDMVKAPRGLVSNSKRVQAFKALLAKGDLSVIRETVDVIFDQGLGNGQLHKLADAASEYLTNIVEAGALEASGG